MISLTIIILIALTLLHSCDTTEPKTEKNITIQEYDVAVTEAYIHLFFESKQKRDLQLYRDGELIYNFFCCEKDTIIVDTSLTVSKSYKYSVKQRNNNTIVAESNRITVTTLVPTSHDFVWETYDLGVQSPSTLSDIYIINDNDIWVVGEFYFDSNVAYGFIHWDGNEWTHIRLFAEVPPANYQANIRPTGVYAFDSNNVWFSAGSVFHWDGKILTPFWLSHFEGNTNPLFEKGQFARKIWGDTNSNEIYVCGDQGALAVYRDNRWESIYTNIDYNILDLWGYKNPATQMLEIICSATDFSSLSNAMIKITKTRGVEIIPWDQHTFLLTLWTNKGFPIFAGGSEYYSNSWGKWEIININEEFIPSKIRGTSLNNIFICGSKNALVHFNGNNWKNINNSFSSGTSFMQIAMNKRVVALGSEKNGTMSIHIIKEK